MQLNTLDYNNWIDNYTDYLFSFAYYKVGKREEAEDLVQETFLSAYKGRETYNGNASEKTWLMSILKNKIVDYYRKPRITHSFSSYLEETKASFESSFFDKEGGRWIEEIDENYFSEASDAFLISKEFQLYLSICLEKMPSKLKAVFISKYLEDKKTDNICKEFNISPSNYWVIIFRSKTILRTCLENKGVLN